MRVTDEPAPVEVAGLTPEMILEVVRIQERHRTWRTLGACVAVVLCFEGACRLAAQVLTPVEWWIGLIGVLVGPAGATAILMRMWRNYIVWKKRRAQELEKAAGGRSVDGMRKEGAAITGGRAAPASPGPELESASG